MAYRSGSGYSPYSRPQFSQLTPGQPFRRSIYVPPPSQQSQGTNPAQQAYRPDINTPISPDSASTHSYNTFELTDQRFNARPAGPEVGCGPGPSPYYQQRYDSQEASLHVEEDAELGEADHTSASGSSTHTRKSVEADPAKQKELLFLAQEVLSQEPAYSSRRKPLSSVLFKEKNQEKSVKVEDDVHQSVQSPSTYSSHSAVSLRCGGPSDYGPLMSADDVVIDRPKSSVSEDSSHVTHPDRERLLRGDGGDADVDDKMVLWTFEPMSPQHQEKSYQFPPDAYAELDISNYERNDKGWMFDATVPDEQSGDSGCCGLILMICSYLIIFFTLPFSLCLTIKVVQEYERAVIFRLGRLLPGGAKGPGLFFIIPCMDSYTKVDIRTVSFDVPPQEVLSKDSVTVAVDAVVYYRVHNATISVTNVEDFSRSTRLLAATTLRNVLGTKNLSEILSERETISHLMQSSLDEATDPWGVKVERVEVKDVRLPVQLQRAMAAEAEAAREARAKVIAAEGEEKASRALKDAADIIQESPAALQLRYLQTLNTISAEKNSTIVFPLPMDFLKTFIK